MTMFDLDKQKFTFNDWEISFYRKPSSWDLVAYCKKGKEAKRFTLPLNYTLEEWIATKGEIMVRKEAKAINDFRNQLEKGGIVL